MTGENDILERLRHPELEAERRRPSRNLYLRNVLNSVFILVAVVAMAGILIANINGSAHVDTLVSARGSRSRTHKDGRGDDPYARHAAEEPRPTSQTLRPLRNRSSRSTDRRSPCSNSRGRHRQHRKREIKETNGPRISPYIY